MAKFSGVAIGGYADGMSLEGNLEHIVVPAFDGNGMVENHYHFRTFGGEGDIPDQMIGAWLHNSLTMEEGIRRVFTHYASCRPTPSRAAIIEMEKQFAACRAERDTLRHALNQQTEEFQVIRTALASRGYEDRGVYLSAEVLRALGDLDKAQEEIEEVRGVLRSTGHADTGRPMESLIDSAIDRERTRHEETLDLLAKELGQEWATWPGREGRKDYAGYAAFLRERIRCDMMSRDKVEMLLTQIARAIDPDFQMGVDHTHEYFAEWIAARIRDIPHLERVSHDTSLGRIAAAVGFDRAWKEDSEHYERVDDLVQHIAEMRQSYPKGAPKIEVKVDLTPEAEERLIKAWKEKSALGEAYAWFEPSEESATRQFMWESGAAPAEPSKEIDPAKIVPPIWNVLADRITNIEKNLPKWMDERVAKAVVNIERRKR